MGYGGGMGSGCMTMELAKVVGVRGRVDTFEFNGSRVEGGRRDVEMRGVGGIVNVWEGDMKGDVDHGVGGNEYRVKKGARDVFGSISRNRGRYAGAFLDLPQPWLTIPFLGRYLTSGGVLVAYTPCVEQASRVVDCLVKGGCWYGVETEEVRVKEFDVDEVGFEGGEECGGGGGIERPRYAGEGEEQQAEIVKVEGGKRKREPYARQKKNVRGHTAFLTTAKYVDLSM